MRKQESIIAIMVLVLLAVSSFAQKAARKELPIIAGRSVHFLDETNAEAIAKASPLFLGNYHNEWSTEFTDYNISGAVYDIVVDAHSISGIYIAGSFDSVGGQAAGRIAKYSTSMDTVIPFANGITGGSIYSLLVISDTNLYAAGWFTIGASAEHVGVAHWNGKTWTAVGPAPDSTVLAIALFNGQIYIGGNFRHIGATEANYIATYDPVNFTWAPLLYGTQNGFDGGVATLLTTETGLYAGGGFIHAAGVEANKIAVLRTNDTVWSPLGDGISGDNSFVTALSNRSFWPTARVEVCGHFDRTGGYEVSNFGEWSEQTQDWVANQPHFNGTTYDAVDVGNLLFVVGEFSKVDTSNASNIASFGYWVPAPIDLGSGLDGPGYALGSTQWLYLLIQHPQNQAYVGGTFDHVNSKKGTNFAIYFASIGGGVHSADDQTFRLSITPNPATDAVTVKLPSLSNSLLIIDPLGRIVMQLGTNQLRGDEATIDTHSLNDGYYAVACQSAEGLYHASLIIRK